jgi:hypothetical protein
MNAKRSTLAFLDIEDTDQPFNPAFEVVCEIDLPSA